MRRRALFLGWLVWSAFGCTPFDTTRSVVPRGTLGEEVVRVFCERMASDHDPSDVRGLAWKPACRGSGPAPADAPPRLLALLRNRARLAAAIDQFMPAPLHDDLGAFLGRLLPLYDAPGERLPRDTRLVADLLHTLAADDEALGALARLGTREGYRPLRLALGVARPALAYPDLDAFAGLALRTLTDRPGDPGDGLAAAEFSAVQAALALELATLEPPEAVDPADASTLALSRDLLLRQDPAFGAEGVTRYALARDARGMALPASGTVVTPFVDIDGDGLADLDGAGRFADATGAALAVPAPFRVRAEAGVPRDGSGRALRTDGTRVWEYVDVEHSALAALAREVGPLFDPATPTAMELARGLPALLGPETELRATYGAHAHAYRGPDTRTGALLEVVYALAEVVRLDSTEASLELLETLVRDHEPETAALVHAAHAMIDRGDAYPEARLQQPNILWDDLITLGIDYARTPGLLEALLRAFADPRSAQLGPVYGGLMRVRDRIDVDPAAPNAPPVGYPLDEPVDRARPDEEGNESLFQRSIALIDGLNGVRVCNREGAVLNLRIRGIPLRYPLFGTARACELIDIPNVAEAYALSILGRYELRLGSGLLRAIVAFADAVGINVDDALEESSGIEGLTRFPTPQALNRLVFWGLDRNAAGVCNSTFACQVFDPVRDRHGNDAIATYPGTIYAWEQPGFYEGMTPLLEVLHRPGFEFEPDGTYRFGRLIGALHRHWASPGHWLTQRTRESAPNFSYQDDGRSYEGLVADGFVEGRLIERLQSAAAATDAVSLRPGQRGLSVLAATAVDLLDPDRNPGLATRDGRTTLPANDRSFDFQVSPLLLMLDALGAMDRALDAEPARRAAWRSGRGRLARRFLDTRPLGDSARFANPRGPALLGVLLPFVRERIAFHRGRSDLDRWARAWVHDTADVLASPLTSGLVRLLDRVQDDAEARDALGRWVGHLVEEASTDDALAATLYGAVDLLFVLEDGDNLMPVAHALSSAFAPNARDVVAGRAGSLELSASVVADGLDLVRDVQERDERRTLRALLGNLVSLGEGDDDITPLETILDVMGEVNRVRPGEAGPLDAADLAEGLRLVEGFLRDERRGLERLYDVVQSREAP